MKFYSANKWDITIRCTLLCVTFIVITAKNIFIKIPGKPDSASIDSCCCQCDLL